MKRFSFISICSFLILFGCASKGVKKMIPTGQFPQKYEKKESNISGQYLLYLPENYSSKDDWPLMLFLHGAGERGDSLELVKTHGPPKLVETNKSFPFVLISPQCPEGDRWSSEKQLEFLTALLDDIVENYRIDSKRIYLTGLSMGGYGTWSLAIKHPNKFAAIAPICGGGNPEKVCEIKRVPTWVFHGAKDNVVPLKRSEEMVSALKACDGNVQLTVYPEENHDSWTETYDNPKLYEWFLSCNLK